MAKKIVGLTSAEAAAAREKYGDNRLSERQTEGFWAKLKRNFADPIIRILCVALAINILFAFLGQVAWYESVGIALAVILATFVSTFSEHKNETAFQKLQQEASLIRCKVWRDGQIAAISIDDIVRGDAVLLQTGDKIPADGFILSGEISVDQSVLNGEAKEAKKFAAASCGDDDKIDFLDPLKVFRGAVVCSGSAVMQVTKIGDQSVYGRLAAELQTDDERDTPLKLKLSHLADQISRFGYYGGVAIAAAYLFQRIVVKNGFDPATIAAYAANWLTVLNDIIAAVMLAVVVIVMAVPEGLPLMIAIVSAQNMGKMLKDNVLVRKLAGIETAGSLNILFSDKTGTITKGQLEAVAFIDGTGKETAVMADIPAALRLLVYRALRYNTGAMYSAENGKLSIIGGNMTERALLAYAKDMAKTDTAAIKNLSAVPFDSREKYSAAAIEENGKILSLIKGAPEKILAQCRDYYGTDGKKYPFSSGQAAVTEKIDALAQRSIRVLAVAASDEPLAVDDALNGNSWTLIGVLGIRDDVRDDAVAAIAEVQKAGVQVVMITGDRKDTALAIAKEAGILSESTGIALTSEELAALTDEEVKSIMPDLCVVSRALPSDKSRLVRLAQEMNLVVGMTGDGVNDSPALKRADVGFAMGGGTEVAKEASEIVILDDNFKSIERSILYGRTIFNNIRKFIIFQLTINVAAVLISFAAPLLGLEPPLTITQILWVNLVMDTLAAMALGGEPTLARYMREKPKRRDEAIINRYMWITILTGAIWTFILSLVFLLTDFAAGYFRLAPFDSPIYLLTGYFAFFIFAAIFNAFNARTLSLNPLDNIARNPGFLEVMALIVIVQLVMTYLGGDIMHCYGLNAKEWSFVTLMAASVIPIDILKKIIIGSHKE